MRNLQRKEDLDKDTMRTLLPPRMLQSRNHADSRSLSKMRKAWPESHLDDLLSLPQQEAAGSLGKHQQFRVLQELLLRVVQAEKQEGSRCKEMVEAVLLILRSSFIEPFNVIEYIKNPMPGRLNAGKLIAYYVPFIILTPFYCYYMAVKHKEEKPYPAATITQTACHYPQDIVFRYYMLIASSMLALIFFMIFKWVEQAAFQSQYPKRISKPLYYLSEFSILLYGITIGTIDGKSTGPLHGPCAVVFFLVLIISIVVITLFITDLRQFDTRAIGLRSLRIKQLLAGYLIAVWIYCIVYLILVSQQEELQGKGDKYVVIVEWNTVTIGLLWVLSWYIEWKHYYLCLSGPKTIRTSIQEETPKQDIMLNKQPYSCPEIDQQSNWSN